MKSVFIVTTLLCSLLLLVGCSRTRVFGSPDGSIQRVAVLPVAFPSEVNRQQAQTLRRFLINELTNRGFTVLDEAIIQRVCGIDSQCPERDTLVTRFGAQGFFEPEITSLGRTNLLAAYVNTISGSVTQRTAGNEVVLKVTHTQRERGGLLFNTGQLVQAVSETVENTERERGFGLFASAYAKALVSKIPSVGVAPVNENEVVIESVAPRLIAGGAQQICLMGTPSLFASFAVGATRTNLREIKPGFYCGIYRISDLPAGDAAVELRSPYGEVVREKVALERGPANECELATKTSVAREGERVKITVDCTSIGRIARFLVYSTASDAAPFVKIGEFSGKSWTGPRPAPESAALAIVPVLEGGDREPPILLPRSVG